MVALDGPIAWLETLDERAGDVRASAMFGEPEEGDAVTETDGVTLVVDPVSIDLVDGSLVDYVEDLGGASFKVTNPNAASGCGCGSSFSV